MPTHWFRSLQASESYDQGWLWQCAIPSGATYKRVRWSWGFAGDTSDTADMHFIQTNLQVAGLCTTIGNGTEVPPHPITTSGDVAPPTQRWLWWEARQPRVAAIDHAAGVISWNDSGPQEIPDVQVGVLATGIPGGDSLNLWFSWQSTNGAWEASGQQRIWVATSTLYVTP